jgi:hypothetical protein
MLSQAAIEKLELLESDPPDRSLLTKDYPRS